MIYRSFLFAPGNHPRRVEKALSLDADAVILDLEDACPIAEKVATRSRRRRRLSAPRTCLGYVRVNATSTEFGYGDIVAVVHKGVDGIVLPKVETADEIRAVDWVIANLEKERGLADRRVDVIPIIETGKGMANIRAITAAGTRVRRIAFGAGDFTLDMNMEWSRAETELLPYRSECVLASRAAEIEAPIDTVWIDLKDPEGFTNSTRHIKSLGFQGKMCIHPDQVPIVNEILSPSAEQNRMVAQGGGGLRGCRGSRFCLDPARGQVYRLPHCSSGTARPGDDSTHRRPKQIAAKQRRPRPWPKAAATNSAIKPLQGMRVIDVSSFLAGPFCATQLGEFGAEVIKIELPKVGDALRKFGTITNSGDCLLFLQESRNKKAATLDLRKPRRRRNPETAGCAVRRARRELPARHAGKMGTGLGCSQKAKPQIGDGAHFGIRPDGALQSAARLRAHWQCLRRAVLSRGLSRPAAGNARLRHHPRLPGGTVWRARRHVRTARSRHDGARTIHRHRPLRTDPPYSG